MQLANLATVFCPKNQYDFALAKPLYPSFDFTVLHENLEKDIKPNATCIFALPQDTTY